MSRPVIIPGRPPLRIATKMVPIVSKYIGKLKDVAKNEHPRLIAVPIKITTAR